MKIIIITNLKCFWKNVHISNTKMLYYDRIEVSEVIDVNKTSAPKRMYYLSLLAFFRYRV